MASEGEFICRICLDDDTRANLIAPCSCRGSQQWVHRACLDRWRSVQEDRAFSRCTECLATYQLVCLTNDTGCDHCHRRSRFCCLVSRDVSLLLLATQACIAIFGLIAYAIDHKGHHFADSFQMSDHLFTFYYLVGLFCSLSLVGICYSCVRCGMCGEVNHSTMRTNPDCCYCQDMAIWPYYMYGSPDCCAGCSCCDACNGCACHEGCATFCASGDCCGGAAMTSIGEEMLVLGMAVLVIFAVIGIFVAVFLGILILQTIVMKHIHVLQKYNLTQEYIVKDLAPDALDVTNYQAEPGDIESNARPAVEMPLWHSNNDYERIGVAEEHMQREDLLPADGGPVPSAPPAAMVYLSQRQRDELTRMGLL